MENVQKRAPAKGSGRCVRISIVDDDESIREALKSLMRSAHLDVEAFGSAEEFLESGNLEETACLILDIRLPGMDGFDLQKQLKIEGHAVPTIFVSAHADEMNRKTALEGGAIEVLTKPVRREPLFSAIQAALKR